MKPRAKSALALAQVRKSVGRSDKKSGKKSDKKILDKRIWGQTM